jgi:hypothetical protein
MRSTQSAVVVVVGLLALGAAACGAAPGDSREGVGSSQSALLTPIRGPIIPPWIVNRTGLEAQWVDANGNPLSSITLAYDTVTGQSSHTGSLSVTMWDDQDATQATEDCGYALMVWSAVPPYGNYRCYADVKGPLLCDGTPFSTAAPATGVPYWPGVDLLTAAFEETVGDSLANVCTATNQNGTTLSTPVYVSFYGWGTGVATGQSIDTTVVQQQPVPVNVTLKCQTTATDDWNE